ncbi:hypothetical protein VKT23_009969 [Stygiomarasmius scandens]|uniref:Uncharacterized protein n=1 Tax=Marasmiellus scandens TaxID=2682957 RepID=A0ABR1JCP6_9AGAR
MEPKTSTLPSPKLVPRERVHLQSQYHQLQLVVRESLPTPTSTQPRAGKTHTFVPIQTGAPVKKGRWSANTDAPQSSMFPTNGAGVSRTRLRCPQFHHLTNNFFKPPLLSLPPLLNHKPNPKLKVRLSLSLSK